MDQYTEYINLFLCSLIEDRYKYIDPRSIVDHKYRKTFIKTFLHYLFIRESKIDDYFKRITSKLSKQTKKSFDTWLKMYNDNTSKRYVFHHILIAFNVLCLLLISVIKYFIHDISIIHYYPIFIMTIVFEWINHKYYNIRLEREYMAYFIMLSEINTDLALI